MIGFPAWRSLERGSGLDHAAAVSVAAAAVTGPGRAEQPAAQVIEVGGGPG
jgi:hypothetical protein